MAPKAVIPFIQLQARRVIVMEGAAGHAILRNFQAIQRRRLPRSDIFLDSLEQIHEPSPPSALFQDAIPLLLGAMQLTLLFAQTRPNRPSLGRLRFAVIVIAVNHVIALLYTNLRAGRAEIFSVFKILFVDFKLSPGLRFPRFVIRRGSRRFQGSANPAHRCLIKGRHIVIFDDLSIAIQDHRFSTTFASITRQVPALPGTI